MASLDSLYHETNRQLSAVHERIGELDRLSMSSRTDTGGHGADPGGLTHRGTNGNERQARDRDELLSMRFTTNEQARSSSSAGSGPGGGGGGSSSDTAVLINAALEHNNRLERSNNYMNDLLAQGSVMLGDLRDQREMIKGFRRKLVDIAGVLGMSGTVMRLIERRQAGDKLVLIGGMVVTCIVMFIVLRPFPRTS